MRKYLKKLSTILINLATRVNNPMVRNEFFVPKVGLEVVRYIQIGDRTGPHHLLRYEWAIKPLRTLIQRQRSCILQLVLGLAVICLRNNIHLLWSQGLIP
jgi:hypothetical protein